MQNRSSPLFTCEIMLFCSWHPFPRNTWLRLTVAIMHSWPKIVGHEIKKSMRSHFRNCKVQMWKKRTETMNANYTKGVLVHDLVLFAKDGSMVFLEMYS